MKQKRCVCLCYVIYFVLFWFGLDPPSIYEWPTKKEGTVVLDPSIHPLLEKLSICRRTFCRVWFLTLSLLLSVLTHSSNLKVHPTYTILYCHIMHTHSKWTTTKSRTLLTSNKLSFLLSLRFSTILGFLNKEKEGSIHFLSLTSKV